MRSFVAPAYRRLSRGHPALAGAGGDAPTPAAATAALRFFNFDTPMQAAA
jgi:hypothetical protein